MSGRRQTLGWTALALSIALVACQPAPPPRTGGATAPPDSPPAGLAAGTVVYSRDGLDLWTSAPDGSGRAALTSDGKAGPYFSARPSPDGSVTAAERSMPGDSGTSLHLLRPGAAAVRLSKPDTFLDGYIWSPDGRYLAYGEVTSGITAAAGGLTGIGAIGEVHLYELATGRDVLVGPGTHPAFTPDGTRLGYAHLSGAIAVAEVSKVVGPGPASSPSILTTLADLTRYSTASAPRGMGLIGGPQFSADGKLVAYAAIEKGPVLEAVQILYIQEASPGAPPKLFVIGKTGAIHHVADMRWSPTQPLLSYTIINAQPHHHWLQVIDARSGERRDLYDSQKHFLDHTWSPDGATILVQVDETDEWLYFRPDRAGPVGRAAPGGWHPEWCTCSPVRPRSP